MASLIRTLEVIAAGRRDDRLRPVTVIVPSHIAGLQLRRRLASLGAFAGVRFETLPRLAEIIGAGELAAAGRSPLARPIGDYVAAQVAREAGRDLAAVSDLPGFGRVLRRFFRRLRRGGIGRAEDARVPLGAGYLGEVLRLYALFRAGTAAFYDEEDLMDAAATVLRRGKAAALADLGAIYVVPPGGLSAGAETLLRALRRVAPSFSVVGEPTGQARTTKIVLAPDPSSEAREAVREVVAALDGGLGLHEVALLHSADVSYRRLLAEALAAAGVPCSRSPGSPLAETRTGRGVLALAGLPDLEYSRSAVVDLLAIAPLNSTLPGIQRAVRLRATPWDRLSRDAGITRGRERWGRGLAALIADGEEEIARLGAEESATRSEAVRYRLDLAHDLYEVIEGLVARLEPLREAQPAAAFIQRFTAAVDEYFDPEAAAFSEVKREIEQLGTVGAVGGSFALSSFTAALRANLEAAFVRDRAFGAGVLVADFRQAAGLQFSNLVLCGCYEGAFPAYTGADTLVPERAWSGLREQFPMIEDAALRLERAQQAAARAVAAAAGGTLVWSAPMYESLTTREYYPSPLMVQAASRIDPAIRSAGELRRAPAAEGVLRRPLSPLAAMLTGGAIDTAELHLRAAARSLRLDLPPGPGTRLGRRLQLLRSRRSRRFSEWDGNLGELSGSGGLALPATLSPTTLEEYAACGFRYLCSRVLRLNVVEEPEEREMMDPAERGTLIHAILDQFFREQQARGRPGPGEPWIAADLRRILEILDFELDKASRRGKTGLDVYATHEARTIRADLAAFLDKDSEFRRETGAVPAAFEVALPADAAVGGAHMRGKVDRIDRTPDGLRAWVIDYKTGSFRGYESLEQGDAGPFDAGTKLQLPAYVAAAAPAEQIRALYWFISSRGDFKRLFYEPTAANQALFEETVKAIAAGIGAGAFPPVPGEQDDFYGTWDNCRYCDFSRICSRRREIEYAAKHDDVAMSPWLGVAATATGGNAP